MLLLYLQLPQNLLRSEEQTALDTFSLQPCPPARGRDPRGSSRLASPPGRPLQLVTEQGVGKGRSGQLAQCVQETAEHAGETHAGGEMWAVWWRLGKGLAPPLALQGVGQRRDVEVLGFLLGFLGLPGQTLRVFVERDP